MTTGRQTGMSLDELLKALESGSTGFPTCLLLNEIGEICESGDGNEAAEQALVSQLESNGFSERAIPFFFLTRINRERANGRLSEVLDSFRKDPENAEVVALVDERLAA